MRGEHLDPGLGKAGDTGGTPACEEEDEAEPGADARQPRFQRCCPEPWVRVGREAADLNRCDLSGKEPTRGCCLRRSRSSPQLRGPQALKLGPSAVAEEMPLQPTPAGQRAPGHDPVLLLRGRAPALPAGSPAAPPRAAPVIGHRGSPRHGSSSRSILSASPASPVTALPHGFAGESTLNTPLLNVLCADGERWGKLDGAAGAADTPRAGCARGQWRALGVCRGHARGQQFPGSLTPSQRQGCSPRRLPPIKHGTPSAHPHPTDRLPLPSPP